MSEKGIHPVNSTVPCNLLLPGKSGQRACTFCGREAIGIQSFGCRSAYVCREHARDLLRDLKPGGRYSTGDSAFERFPDRYAGLPDTHRLSGISPSAKAICGFRNQD